MSIKGIFLYIFIPVLILGAVYYFFIGKEKNLVARKPVKIGIVNTSIALESAFEGLKKGLNDLGYKEGNEVIYSYAQVTGSKAKAAEVIKRFIDEGYDIIVPIGIMPASLAKGLTFEFAPDLPIVFAVVSDPQGAGLVRELSSSGNNITGVTPANEVVSAKRLELFKQLVPGLKRIVFPYNDSRTTGIDEIKEAAPLLGLELVDEKINTPAELDLFLRSFDFKPGDGFLRATDSVIGTRLKEIIELTVNKKVPMAGANIDDAKIGALMSYGANYFEIGEQAAALVYKILAKKERPTNLPVELPRKYELVVNLNTAKQIGLLPDQNFLSKADIIIGR